MPELRDIIEIDEEKCTGCGLCVPACAEGALQIIDGKARLVGEVYCDGLGACLGECPEGALKVIKREAEPFDEKAVEELLSKTGEAPDKTSSGPPAGGCPSVQVVTLDSPGQTKPEPGGRPSGLGHWPIKLQLMVPQAPFLKNADLVLLADCAAAAYPDLHDKVLPGKAVALACPKLDDPQAHIHKLATLLAGARPRSLSVVHMEVPCCSGLEFIARKALEMAGMEMPVGRLMISNDGKVLRREGQPWESAA